MKKIKQKVSVYIDKDGALKIVYPYKKGLGVEGIRTYNIIKENKNGSKKSKRNNKRMGKRK